MPLPARGKLVRDRIPDIIRAAGRQPTVLQLAPQDRLAALRLKLTEETTELQEASSAEIAEELADVYEILRAIASELDLEWHSIDALAKRKRNDRGSFGAGLWLLHPA